MLDIIPLRYFRSAIITMMFLIYIVIMMCVMESLHYLDRNNINPYISLWKKILWIIVLPWHNNARDLIVKLKLRPRIRQPYYIGSIEKNTDEFRKYLTAAGFEETKLAWIDDGEILSLRKIDGKFYQHHIRVFSDGEVRGHFEYTPESHMVKHVMSIGMVFSPYIHSLVTCFNSCKIC